MLVIAEGLPFRFVGMGKDNAVKRHRSHAFGGVVVAFLGGRQQRMQHLDGRLEHFHEFHQALIGFAQAAAEAVGVRVILGIVLQHADVDLAHQRGNILVVVVARLGLGHTDLVQHRWVHLHHAELADITAILVQTLHRPGRHDGLEVAGRDAVFLFQNRRIFRRVEQAQGRFVYRRALDGIEGHFLHQ